MKPRILFVGYADSSHTAAWIDLLDRELVDVRLFALPSLAPPAAVDCPIYTTDPGFGLGKARGPALHAYDPTQNALKRLSSGLRRAGARFGAKGRPLTVLANTLARRWPDVLEQALDNVLIGWRPDIVHTLGFEPASYLYMRTIQASCARALPRWVAQARGGPDLDLFQHLPERLERMREVFRSCDHYICDNQQNYEFAFAQGLDRAKAMTPGVGVVSGAGGIDVDRLHALADGPPSVRERVVVWPKTYETMSSKALPVLEALNTVWDQVAPFRIECLWMVQDEVRIWFEKMVRPEVKAACRIHGRIDREVVLGLMGRARVMLAPSLTDGIPNTMLEAMATGAFPIVSPLATITPVVEHERNVLFARNLYPDEIAHALQRALLDDDLVDRAAQVNFRRVRELADRDAVRTSVRRFYAAIAKRGDPPMAVEQDQRGTVP